MLRGVALKLSVELFIRETFSLKNCSLTILTASSFDVAGVVYTHITKS